MPDIRKIRVTDGRRLRHPATLKVVRAEGETVTWNSFWERRLRDGDIEIVDGAQSSSEAAAAAPGAGATSPTPSPRAAQPAPGTGDVMKAS